MSEKNKKKKLNLYAIQVYPRSIKKPPIERRRCLRPLWVFNGGNDDFKLVKLGENELRKRTVNLKCEWAAVINSGQMPSEKSV